MISGHICIVLPSAPTQEYIVRYVGIHEEILRQQEAPALVGRDPRNVRFVHDPQWRDRLFSLQCVHDAVKDGPTNVAGVFWVFVVQPMFVSAMCAFPLLMIYLRYKGFP